MAYAIQDAGGWIARFRGYQRQGRHKAQVRVPRDRLRPGHEEEDARAYAAECDNVCRLLEVARSPATIARALTLKAISVAQADAMRARQAAVTPSLSLQPLTILDAARMHPASHREIARDLAAAARHERELGVFQAFAGETLLQRVTLDQVLRYVETMTAEGISWDGRRHRLLWLRRATRMGTARGLPDVLGSLALDRRPPLAGGGQVGKGYWSLAELARGVVRAKDARLRAVIGLGGFLGLRPSEIFHAQITDIDDGHLRTGMKNVQSVRMLPVPSLLREWIAAAIAKRKEGLIVPTHGKWGHKLGRFTEASFGFWFDPLMAAASGKKLSPKYLRKSFTGWAFRSKDLPTQHVEAIMGHKTALASIVTGRHYLPELVARELRPPWEDAFERLALAPERHALVAR